MVNFALAQTVAFAFMGEITSNPRLSAKRHCQQKQQQQTLTYKGGAHVSPSTLGLVCSSNSVTQKKTSAVSPLFENNLNVVIDTKLSEGNHHDGEQFRLEDLYSFIGAKSKSQGLLRLDTRADDNIRGVYLNAPVMEGELILGVPLNACLLDDEPPEWWTMAKEEEEQQNNDDDEDRSAASSFSYNNPSDWAPRLAASLIDLQLKNEEGYSSGAEDSFTKGKELWLSCLPDPDFLRASLPVHWSEEILRSARCTALELAVDSAYFARAEAVADLIYGLRGHCSQAQSIQHEVLERICHNALDVVQTRSCRAENMEDEHEPDIYVGGGGGGGGGGGPLRVLAPIFDMINHSSSRNRGGGGESKANAKYGVEMLEESQAYLSVRAVRDIEAGSEVFIDYGTSTRPPWKCLLSYGFVPQQSIENICDDSDDDQIVAEVFMDGNRYEVGPSTVPIELVAAASTSLLAVADDVANASTTSEDEIELTPEVALKLAKRISEASFYLLLDGEENTDASDFGEETEDAGELISLQLASSLRWAQHRILRVCAEGLDEYARK